MRNVARRFQKRWSLAERDGEWFWRQVVGGWETHERCLPGEVDAVHELDHMD
jgi:hypothetical protein